MIHFLSKLLPLPFYPVGLAGLLALLAGLAALSYRRRLAIRLTFASLAVLWFFSSPWVSHGLVRSLEKKYAPLENCPPAPVIALLGGAGQAPLSPRIHDETNHYADRIIYAARLFKQGCAPFILASGGRVGLVHDFQGSEALINARLLNEVFGVGWEYLLLEEEAKNTRDHPRFIAPILDSLGAGRSIIVITSAMHMHRSLLVFKKAGFEAIPAPTDYFEDEKFHWGILKVIPQAASLHLATMALHEYYGLLAYKILGWI